MNRRRIAGWKLAAVAVILGLAPVAWGEIIITVTGTPGSGSTDWSFSGSATVGDGNIIFDNDDPAIDYGWEVGDPFYTDIDDNIDFSSTTAMFTAGGVEYFIMGVGELSSTRFGIAIEDATPTEGGYQFTVGTVLAFSGSGTAPVDINEFAQGATAATDWYSFEYMGTLPVTFNVIPEPATGMLLVLGTVGLLRRRRSARLKSL